MMEENVCDVRCEVDACKAGSRPARRHAYKASSEKSDRGPPASVAYGACSMVLSCMPHNSNDTFLELRQTIARARSIHG